MIGVFAIDSTVITQSNATDTPSLINLINKFITAGVRIAVVATREKDVKSAESILVSHGVSVDLYISGEKALPGQAMKFKGGPQRIESIGKALGFANYKILYLGDDRSDYTSAVNAGAFFILANWINKNRGGKFTSQSANSPQGVWIFASHFLMHAPRWTFSLDAPAHSMKFRALMSANTGTGGNITVLRCDPPKSNFLVRDVIKDHRSYTAGGRQASEILMWHTIASAKLEGLFDSRTIATIYPSSKMGQTNPTLAKFISVGSIAFGSRFIDNLIMRAVSVDSSRELRNKGIAPDFQLQTDSVHLNPDFGPKGKARSVIEGKKVVVFDDFHTGGNSLDWARNLLITAGASEVILISIGKFGGANLTHRIYVPNSFTQIDPFKLKKYGSKYFRLIPSHVSINTAHTAVISRSFNQFVARAAY